MTLIIFLLTISLRCIAPVNPVLYVERSPGIWYVSMADVTKLLLKHQIKSRDIVLKQIILETGYLKSEILKQNKNCLGMKYAPSRKTTAIGELNHCAVYLNIEDCIIDLKIWQDKYYLRGGSYYDFLQRIGYAEDKRYIDKLKRIKI